MSDAIARSEYADLRARLMQEGLFERNWIPYTASFLFMLTLLCGSIAVLYLTQNVFLILLNAVFLAFLYGRFGLLAHDFGHQQVFASRRLNDAFGHACCAAIGLSYSWWNDKHNEHHAHTNFEDGDPDIDIPFLAYSEHQAKSKKGLERWVVARQHWFFIPFQFLSHAALRKGSVAFTFRERHRKDFVLNVLLYILHAIVYFGVIFTTQVWWVGILFVLVHHKLWSAYITSIFAPNHKGMPVLAGTSVNFLREQIMTARNVRPNWLTNYYYGHLNLQIEHHVFPIMPRHHYVQARPIIKRFCEEKNIDYHETSVIGSYIEILRHMRAIALFAR